MKKIEIKIPDIAENVESGLIAAVLVSKGDQVEKEQSLVEVETDKATTDIPSTHAGTVEEIKVEEGDEVKVSQVIMVLSVEENGDEESTEKEKAAVKKETRDEKADESGDREEEKEEREEDQKDDQEKDRKEGREEEDDKEDRKEGREEEDDKGDGNEDREEEGDEEGRKEDRKEEDDKDDDRNNGSRESGEEIAATPLVKRIAREEGIDLKGIRGSGPQGRITRDDLQSRIREQEESKEKEGGAAQESQKEKERSEPASGAGDSARETREKMSTIRKLTAQRMQESWKQIPHVTQFDQADITDLEEFRQQQKSAVEREGGKLTVTALLLKITAYALQRFPRFNARLDEETEEIIYKHEIHIGVAVDTDRGLMVPVIRDVNRKSLAEISRELSETAEKARNKKISPDELQGGTFTVSNLGGIGGTAFTPIVYAPQVAILGVSRSRYQPVYKGEEVQKRLIMPLSLSYDHRVIDGAEGARFLTWISAALENPFALLQ